MSDSQIVIVESAAAPGEMTVQVRGSLTIALAREAHAALVKAFAKAQQVLLDLEGVEEIDLTGLQLVCAAHRSSSNAGKGFQVKGHDSEPVARAAVKAGFLRRIGCVQETKMCFWCGGAN
jgi:anti-anti-sigma regulatory factor